MFQRYKYKRNQVNRITTAEDKHFQTEGLLKKKRFFNTKF